MRDMKDVDQKMGRGKDGKYLASHDKVCVCGRTLHCHLVVRPYPQDDTSDGFPECAGFKKAKIQPE